LYFTIGKTLFPMKTVRSYLVLLFWACMQYQAHGQIITTVAGNGTGGYSGDYGPATAAQIRSPRGIAKDDAGNLYFSEPNNYIVRKVSPTGTITTYAGTGSSGFSGDGGPATIAQLGLPTGIALDKAGNLYIATAGARVRKVDPAGNISTFAGTGSGVISGDGSPATAAGLGSPIAVGVDTGGNVYIGGSYCIRKVDNAGIITTIAGTGTLGFSGDGGPATSATIRNVDQVIADRANNIYFTDEQNNRVRKIDGAGIITTVAGSGIGAYAGDGGMAIDAKLSAPYGVFVDSCGLIYISGFEDVIRVVNSLGRIYTIAGTGVTGFSGDGGPASSAQLNKPTNLFLDKNNDLFFTDALNYRVRKIELPRCDSLVFPSAVADVTATGQGMHIYPNPNEGDFSIKINTGSSAPVQVSIVTIVGAVVRQYTIPPGKETPLQPHLPPGMYMVVAVTEQGRLVEKMVVR
jgi:hypothetical protein